MARFTAFKDWKLGKRVSTVKEGEKKEDEKIPAAPGNAELLALIDELSLKRNEATRANDGLGRQVHDLDIRIAKLDMQKNELLSKREALKGAKEISETSKRKPRSNHD